MDIVDEKIQEKPELPGFSDIDLAALDHAAGQESSIIGELESDAEMAANKKAAAEQKESAEGWLLAVAQVKDLIVSPFPEAAPVWTDDRMENLAGALARCDAAYGWGGIGGLFQHPLIGLAVVSFPLAVGTAKAINAAKAAKALPPGVVRPGAHPDAMGEVLAPQAAA